MNKYLPLFCVLVLIASVQPRPSGESDSEEKKTTKKVDVCENLKSTDSLDGVYHQFKQVHNKQYAGEAENEERRQIFENNAKAIIAHNEKFNRGEVTYKQGCNAFTDMREEEKPKHFGYKPQTKTE